VKNALGFKEDEDGTYTMLLRPTASSSVELKSGSAATAQATEDPTAPGASGAPVNNAECAPADLSRRRMWHGQLGHWSYGGLQHDTKLVGGLPFSSAMFSKTCLFWKHFALAVIWLSKHVCLVS